MGEFSSNDHYIYHCGQEYPRRNGVAFIVNKRVWKAVLGCDLKNNRKISVYIQGKPFNITAIQVYAPTTDTQEAEVEQFYEDLQDLLELMPKKVFSIIGDWNENWPFPVLWPLLGFPNLLAYWVQHFSSSIFQDLK